MDVTRPGRVATWLLLGLAGCGQARPDVTVGAKNFSEQTLLGEIVAQWVEARTELTVDRRFQLGGTLIAHRAVSVGEIDLYVEYTGTALTAILDLEPASGADAVLATVRDEYARRWGLEVFDPLGFENSFAMLLRGSMADSLGVITLSELAPFAPDLKTGFGYEFVERADGYAGLIEAYELEFEGAPRTMDLGLIYHALASGRIDLTAGNSTEGKIASLDLHVLEDDRGYFPPYEGVIVAHGAALARHVELRPALEELSGRLDTEDIRALNRLVDVEGRRAADVASEWVARELDPPATDSR